MKVDRIVYEDLADCIRSEQVPPSVIAEYFEDKNFYKRYKKKYLDKRKS